MATSMNPILAAAGVSDEIGTASAEMSSNRRAQVRYTDTNADLQLDLGMNNVLIQGVKDQAELATQLAAQKSSAIFGTDLRSQAEVLTGLADQQRQAYEQRMTHLKDIQAKDSVGFMDNPLGYIINQFAVNDDIRKHNAALEIENAAGARINQLNQESSATAINQKNFEVSVSQASIDANAKNLADAAAVAANKARIDGLSYNVEALQTSINASKEQLAIKFQVLGAQNTQAQLKLAMNNYAMHVEEFNWRKLEKEKGENADSFFIENIQKGLITQMGNKAPNLSASPKVAQQWLMLLKSNTEAGKMANDALMAGMSGVLGGNPAQVIDMINKGAAVEFTPAQAPIKNIFQIATQNTAAGVAAGTVTKANYQTILTEEVNKQVDTYLKNIEPGSANNPFNIGSLKTIVAMPGVSNTPLAQKVLGPMVASGAALDDPKQVYAVALKAVADGKVTPEQAADGIVALYQKGVATNLDSRNLVKFGIVPSESMYSYRTQVEVKPNALFGGTEIVNLTNPNDVKRAMMRTLADQSRAMLNPLILGIQAGMDNRSTVNPGFKAGQTDSSTSFR